MPIFAGSLLEAPVPCLCTRRWLVLNSSATSYMMYVPKGTSVAWFVPTALFGIDDVKQQGSAIEGTCEAQPKRQDANRPLHRRGRN